MTNPSKHKVVLLLSPSSPPVGGITSWTKNFLQLMEGNCEMLLVNQSNIYVCKANAYVDRFFSALTFLKTLLAITYFAVTRNIDGAHLSTSLSPYGIIREEIYIKVLKLFNCPTVLHIHCTIQDMVKIYDHATSVHRLLLLSDHVVTLNKNSRNYAIENGCRQISIASNFGDSRIFPRISYSDTIQKVLLVGHVTKYKGVKEYLDAARRNLKIEFMIAGDIVDTELLDQKPENVNYLGSLSDEALNAIYRDADLFILPTYTEGFSMSLLEAMSHGLPIITTDVGANCEMIGSEGGILIQKYDSEALSNAVKKLSSVAARQKAGLANLKKYRRDYSCDKALDVWTNVYDNTFKS